MKFYLKRITVIICLLINTMLFSQAGKTKAQEDWGILNIQLLEFYKDGKFGEAIKIGEEAKKIAALNFKEHPNYLTTLFNLGQSYKNFGDYKKALSLLLEYKENIKRHFGEEHTKYVSLLNILADIFVKQKDYKNALSYYNEIKNKTSKKNDSEYILILSRLANINFKLENYKEALPLSIELKTLRKKTLGNEHQNYIEATTNLATLYKKLGTPKKAIPLFIESKVLVKKTLGTSHQFYFSILNSLANTYNEIKQYNNAIPILIEIKNNIEKAYGKKHKKYENVLNRLAITHQVVANYEEALPLRVELSEIRKIILGNEHPEYISSLINLADIHFRLENYQEALPLFIKVKKSREKKFGNEHLEYITSLNALAAVYYKLKKYEEALSLFIKVKKFREKKFGNEHPDYITSLNNVSGMYYHLGDFERTLPLRIELKKIKKKVFGEKHPEYAKSLYSLANTYNKLNLKLKALLLYADSKIIIKHTLGTNNLDYLNSLNGQAKIYHSTGDYKLANSLYIEAEEITNFIFGKFSNEYSKVLNNIGILQSNLGNSKEAISYLIKAKEIIKKKNGIQHANYANSLHALGNEYYILSDYKKAILAYNEAKEIIRLNLGKQDPKYIKTLHALGNLYVTISEYKKGISLLIEVKKYYENKIKDINYSGILNSIGTLYYLKGNFKQAKIHYLKAKEIIKTNKGFYHPDYSKSLNNMARLYSKFGYYKEASYYYSELNDNIIYQINDVFKFRTEKERKLFLQNKIKNYFSTTQSFNYKVKTEFHEFSSLVTNNSLLLKSLLLNTSKKILPKLEKLNDEKIRAKVVDFRNKRDAQNKLELLPIYERGENFQNDNEKLNNLEAELMHLYSKHFNEDLSFVKDWKDVKLKEHEVAIEFSHFRYLNNKWTDSTMYVAYVYKKGLLTPKTVTLFEEKELINYFKAGETPNDLYSSRGSVGSSKKINVSSDSFYKLIWKPLEKHLNNVTTVYYAPDGLLHKIPFAALKEKNQPLLMERYKLEQLSTTANIGKNKTQPNLNDILLIGGVLYDYKLKENQKLLAKKTYNILESDLLLGDKGKRSDGVSWSYLQGTQDEISSINKKLNQAKTLSGYQASEESFKKLSGKSPSVLHIATHGFFFENLKGKHLNEFISEEKNTYKLAEDPLLRSGLILAGANYTWKNGNNPYEKEDGILTALEISNLDLSKTDIVILSACETGLGDVNGSEGVYGLQRAFKMAGVEIIVMSLWQVPDQETSEFMNLFYTKWLVSNKVREAFNETQHIMQQKYKDEPEKWAAFVMFE